MLISIRRQVEYAFGFSGRLVADHRIGIVGGGQLARMLTQAAEKQGVSCWVLDPDPQCPAVLAGANFVEGDSWRLDALQQLGDLVDVITVEIENVDVDNLALLETEGMTVIPAPATLALLVNKHTQKQTLSGAGLPTAEYRSVGANEEVAEPPYGMPLVWKASRGGYDGRGVIVIEDATQLPLRPDVEGYVEAFVDAKMEIAVMVAVNASGEATTWTSVEMAFSPETNMLQHLIAPARVSDDVDQRARKIAIAAVKAVSGVGIFGVEMFLTRNDEILINEIAPRTHNSGHFSMDAAVTSQFEQQCRLLTDQPLGDTTQTKPAAMVNVLGAPGFSGSTVVENLEEVEQLPGVSVHLYGKKACFSSRKMGHATITASSIDEAIGQSEEVQSRLVVRGEHSE